MRITPLQVAIRAATLVMAGSAVSASATTLHGPPAVAQAVLEAEHAFAGRVAEAGVAQGFREFMDPQDGLSFGGGAPTRGAEAIYRASGGDKPSAVRLTWEPEEIFAARAGDMAVSWGRYVLTPNDPAKTATTGRFVTVWRKDANGSWKGLVDIGAPD